MNKDILALLNSGSGGRVKKINTGGSATRRLYEMGFHTGADVKVVKNDNGPVIVSLSGNKVAIGRGLAQKIMVDKIV